MNVLAYCDGQRDLMGIAETIGLDALQCARICDKLLDAGVIEIANPDMPTR
jgi:aminopeptidase-like protein